MTTTDQPRAAAQVCAIPELLTIILEQVEDPLQLFVLQSVNSTFQAIVRDTKSIRQRMCLEPTEHQDGIALLLQREQVRKVTYPFSVRLMSDSEHEHRRHFVDFELACSWIGQHGYNTLQSPGPHDFARAQVGSWRGIILAAPNSLRSIMITCSIESWLYPGNLSGEDTLGLATNRVAGAACKGWKDVRCTHGWQEALTRPGH